MVKKYRVACYARDPVQMGPALAPRGWVDLTMSSNFFVAIPRHVAITCDVRYFGLLADTVNSSGFPSGLDTVQAMSLLRPSAIITGGLWITLPEELFRCGAV